ncbi:MAG: universal stress protein [Desulfotomaculaceae bacterium]|nr:universal stress protein [Desulfotomaculaceae bacterium]
MKKLLLSSDGSENALRAAGFAAELVALAPDVKVTVLVVNDILEKMKYYSPLQTPVILEEVEVFFDEKVQDAMERTTAVFDKNKIKVDRVVKVGNPAQVIVDLAHDEGFDLIVIGSRGMGSLKGIVLGSVSSKVLQLANCPVTIVK